jgi:acylphosphatase
MAGEGSDSRVRSSGGGPEPADECAEFLVEGDVQGVGFRYFTQRVADRLGVRGFVRNLEDGSVQVVAQAPGPVLDQLETVLRQGPRLGRVDSVVRRSVRGESFRTFELRF